MKSPYTLGPRRVSARCLSCGWSLEGPNAQGVGAQHAEREGHQVRVEVYQELTYGAGRRPREKQEWLKL